MNRMNLFVFALVTTLLSWTSQAQAASVNIVHGIDGRDLGGAKELAVDIAVNGSCALKGVTFTQSAQVELSPATYQVTIHPANGTCGITPLITESLTIPSDASRSFSAVASLSKTGAPSLVLFNNSRDLVFPPSVSTRHLAFAGSVFVTYRGRDLGRPQSSRISNGETANIGLLGNRLKHSMTVSTKPRRGQIARVDGVSKGNFIIYNIVGSKNNGFTVIREKLTP